MPTDCRCPLPCVYHPKRSWWSRRTSEATSVNLRMRTGWLPDQRTLADDLRENPRPVDVTPHVHFHAHGGTRHGHEHVHPSEHAHSTRSDTPAHTEAAA